MKKYLIKITQWLGIFNRWVFSFPVPDFNKLGGEREYVL